MKINSIAGSKFRSFLSPFSLTIPPPGLYYLTGVNKVDPELGANGIGKSSLFQAVHWALFGKLSTNLKAKDVANWKQPKGCCVVLKGEHELVRTWSPNSLKLDGKEVDQQTLETELRVSPATFTHSHFFPQAQDSFLDLRPEQKLTLLVDILNLHVWERASDLAAKEFISLESSAFTIEGRLAEIAVRLKQETAEADLKKQSVAWEWKHKLEVAKLKKEIADAQNYMGHAKKAREESRLALQNAQRTAKGMETATLKMSIQAESNANAAHGTAKSRVASDYARLKAMQSLQEGTCPRCNQRITVRHKLDETARIQKEIAASQKEQAAALAVLNKAQESLSAVQEQYDKAQAKLDSLAEKAQAESIRVATAEAEYAGLVRRVDKLQHDSNPFVSQIDQIASQRLKSKLRAASLRAELTATRESAVAINYWTKGFKEVRLLVVKETLAQLEAEVNQAIHGLGLAGWRIAFAVEKENRSGGVQRGFNTLVLSPANTEAVPWESWSGGEKQRLRFAGQLGFANLIDSMSGQAPNYEFWDEPSSWTSARGIEQMLEALRDRATRYNRAILVADHRALDYGRFAGVINIVKDSNGSRIVNAS